jgi:DNA gyrase subunit B
MASLLVAPDTPDIVASIRKRPGMYVGDVVDGSGLRHLLWEVVGNAVDEHLAGFCRSIHVTLHEGGAATIDDDGRGIPVEPLADGVPFLTSVLTTSHDSPTFDGHGGHVHLDGAGLGLIVVSALSREVVVESARGGRLHRQVFGAGVAIGPLADLGPTERKGTRVTFAPDPGVFTTLDFDATRIRDRLHEIAAFTPGLVLHFADERRTAFACPRGIVDLLPQGRHEPERLPDPPLYAKGSEGQVQVEVALQWAPKPWRGVLRSFVNLYETNEGGTHVAGLRKGLDEVVAGLPRRERAPIARLLRERTVGIVSVLHRDPEYGGPTRARLTSPDVQPVVEAVVRRCLRDFAGSRPEEARRLIESVQPRG